MIIFVTLGTVPEGVRVRVDCAFFEKGTKKGMLGRELGTEIFGW
jgi:hypothetical protein